ncbi:DUF1330 domain-containing protein [Wukongibacter baidiensis]|uniref:DUF1330 domain-containing protein n=1 Tax=Wukongibacter baidiensis TaxID=1723361 RepID=UPI003D7FD4DF
MSAYFVAQIRIEDEVEYQKYLDQCDTVFKNYKGKYLVVENQPTVLEGEWKYSRMIIIEFESEDALRDWYESDEYQEILKFRLNASKCDTVIVKGLN